MKIKRVTTRDIAKHLGVHYTTVAEALRNSARISEKTRQRVHAAAAELGYRPDPILSALNAYRCDKQGDRRSATIAWINTYPSAETASSRKGFNGHCLEGATKRVNELGFKLENFWLKNPRIPDKRASQILVARGIKGILIPPLSAGVESLDFDWENFAAVRLGVSFRDSKLPCVTPDVVGNTITLFKFLVNSGFGRIGYACPRWIDQRVNSGFIAGYMGAHHEYLAGQAPLPVFDKTLDERTRDEFLEWVKGNKFDALILHRNDDYESVLQSAGIRIPEDLSLAWTSLFQRNTTRTGIFENGDIVGRHGVDQVVAMLNRSEYGVPDHQMTIRVHGSLNLGETVKHAV